MFDFKSFMACEVGDSHALVTLFKRYGVSAPKFDAIYKWRQRNTISIEWLIPLLALLELENGAPVSVAKYVRG